MNWNLIWRRDFSSGILYFIGLTFEIGITEKFVFLTPRQAPETEKAVLTNQIWTQRTVLWKPDSLQVPKTLPNRVC